MENFAVRRVLTVGVLIATLSLGAEAGAGRVFVADAGTGFEPVAGAGTVTEAEAGVRAEDVADVGALAVAEAGTETGTNAGALAGAEAGTGAERDNYDVFIPIAKYIRQGDAEKLSAWFGENLEVAVLSKSVTCSKSQAKRIVAAFFETYKPRDFVITHRAGRSKMKYALGELSAGGQKYEVTIYIYLKEDGYRIQLFKVEKRHY